MMMEHRYTAEISRKFDTLIAFGYATILSLGIACCLQVLILNLGDGSRLLHPYAEPAARVLGIVAFLTLFGLVVLDCIRGRKMRFAILLRLGITALCVIPFSFGWLLAFRWITSFVRFVRSVFC